MIHRQMTRAAWRRYWTALRAADKVVLFERTVEGEVRSIAAALLTLARAWRLDGHLGSAKSAICHAENWRSGIYSARSDHLASLARYVPPVEE